MAIAIAIAIGIREQSILAGIFMLHWCTMMYGLLTEYVSLPKTRPDRNVYSLPVGAHQFHEWQNMHLNSLTPCALTEFFVLINAGAASTAPKTAKRGLFPTPTTPSRASAPTTISTRGRSRSSIKIHGKVIDLTLTSRPGTSSPSAKTCSTSRRTTTLKRSAASTSCAALFRTWSAGFPWSRRGLSSLCALHLKHRNFKRHERRVTFVHRCTWKLPSAT